jgi:hypothetical protein
MVAYLGGMITMGFAVAGLLFYRYWRRTADGLFLAFAAAFALLALNQALLILSDTPREEQTWFYLLRLLAFGLLIVAIVGKNLRRADGGPPA